ncbi:hypothetical protein GO730_38880 [Spirosoma sp. HMF3257]|uniref:Uncharacterized protein n=1 Tax=Spirosoma telluris TaxID=2183553 RepID=A0A327NJY5_9BACT|nr:hypothetical protein [Spirosoma telluris]RAI72868.1 hypothetical protein HMF3257_38810 [Spirosoma telluris]
MFYAKCYQRDGLFNFYKVDETKNPIVVEVVCFLNDPPHLRVDTYSSDTPSGRIEIDALKNYYPRISEDEYKTAFAKATATNFKIL